MPKSNRIDYRISWSDPLEHLFDIEVRFVAGKRETVLSLPAWRPGRYLIQNHAANVRQWSAEEREGKPLRVRKRDKTSWIVRSEPGTRVVFRYRYYAGVLDAGSSFLDAGEAYFNGSNLFVMVEGRRANPVSLEIDHPHGWSVETQLRPFAAARWRARDYDYLVDSPTLISPSLRRHVFTESGCEVSLVFQGAEGIDTQQFVQPVRAIVREQGRLFGGIPSKSYRFLFHVADKWHGVEHEDSCSIILKRSDLVGSGKGDEGYDHTLSIISHEFFHLWNVKRLLPAAFVPYDYSREVHTKLLWLMEGVTSYYGQLTLRRAGIWSRERYLEQLGREISTLESTPGRAHLSLAQASLDSWLQDPAQMHDRSNAWISFYNKGEIVAALLDLTLRASTGGEVSLDDLMRKLWNEYGSVERGLEEDSVERVAVELGGRKLRRFFQEYVDGVSRLPYEEVLGRAGILFESVSAGGEAASIAAKFRPATGRLVVDSVRAGGTAAAAGLLAGDELLAIDRNRVVSEREVNAALGSGNAGRAKQFLFARHGVLRSQRVVPMPDPERRVKLEIGSERSREEETLLSGWLGSE